MKFYEDVRHMLGERAAGFDAAFNYLKNIKDPLIIETGCAREENNYLGDGQSSLLFDQYISEYGGHFMTVDISDISVNYCKSKMISKNSLVIKNDSILFLKKLNEKLLADGKKIDFLYLDSFDAPRDQPDVVFRSALHHMYELATILPSLNPGALIGVDDNWVQDYRRAGKGCIIADYMNSIGITPIFDQYQIFWKL